MTKKQEIEMLYKKLIDSRFAFVGHGEHKLSDIYSAVEQEYPTLCNKHYRCSESCSKGRSKEFRWMHTTRNALGNLKVCGRVQKGGYGMWILNEQSSRKKRLGVRKNNRSKAEVWVAVVNAQQGAGFGTTEENKRVERAAVRFVTRDYETKGWQVRNISGNKKHGYDLLCKRGNVARHVEVKGARGNLHQFIITAHEVEVWKSDARYVLALVTKALSKNASLLLFASPKRQTEFDLDPIAYLAKHRPKGRRRGDTPKTTPAPDARH